MSNKLRILLADDLPTFCYDDDENVKDVVLGAYEPFFELIWVQNAVEARFVLDGYDFLSARQPEVLAQLKLPPELLIFDYAQTQGGLPRIDSRVSNIIPRLRELCSRFGLPLDELPGDPDSFHGPGTGTPKGKDRNGCYIGGELARAFGTHPCGALPTTAHIETKGTDAAFYEWLNKRYFHDLFKDRTRAQPSWGALLPRAVQSLRKRIEALATAGLVRVSLADLDALITRPRELTDRSVTLHTRFGQRCLLVRGLFIDLLPPDYKSTDAFAAEAPKWADSVRTAMFREYNPNEFTDARQVAQRHLETFLSEVCPDRYQLSALAVKQSRTPAQQERFEQLCTAYQVDPQEVQRDPKAVRVHHHSLPLWNHGVEGAVARWAALMLAVRAEQYCRRQFPATLRIEDVVRSRQRDEEDTLVSLTDLAEEMGQDVVDTALAEGGLRIVGEGQEAELRVPRAANLDNILMMLDPAPESLLTYQNKGANSQRDATCLTNPLRRLGHTGTGWGPLGLNLSDVLQPRRPDAGENGIRPREGNLLRAYAEEIEFPADQWPAWLHDAP